VVFAGPETDHDGLRIFSEKRKDEPLEAHRSSRQLAYARSAMAVQLKRSSTERRAQLLTRWRRAGSAMRSHKAPAKSSSVERISTSHPSCRPSPAQPAGVETTALPHAIASITLILVPADTSRG